MKVVLLVFIGLSLGACAGKGKKECYAKKKAKIEKHFNVMDADKDGKVSKKEFDEGHKAKFTEMDANKDGFVTFEEKWNWKMDKCKKCKGQQKKKCKSCGA